MRCPKCGCLDDKVIDSRAVKDGAPACAAAGSV